MHSWNVIPLVQWKRHIYRHQQCNSHQDPCLRKAQICTAANMHMILILQVWSTQWDHLTLHCQACQPSDQCSSWDPAKSDHWRWPQQVTFSPADSTRPKAHQTATPTPTIKAALDSGASANCFPASCKGTNDWPVLPVKTARAQVANYGLISSTATDELASTQLPPISEQVDECNEMTTPYCQSMNCAKVTLQSSFEVRKPTNQQHKPTTLDIPICGEPPIQYKPDTGTELFTVDIHARNTTSCKFQRGTIQSSKPLKWKASPSG